MLSQCVVRAGLLEQEQWGAALVARDFQRSVDAMQARGAKACAAANGGSPGSPGHVSSSNGHAGAVADAPHQNGNAGEPPASVCWQLCLLHCQC